MKSLGREPFEQDDFQSFLDGMKDETDRSCAIMTGAIFERYLGYRLDLEFIHLSPKEAEELFVDANGVLGTFSSRIVTSRALGLISPEQKEDLNRIRLGQRDHQPEYQSPNINFPSSISIQCDPLLNKLPGDKAISIFPDNVVVT